MAKIDTLRGEAPRRSLARLIAFLLRLLDDRELPGCGWRLVVGVSMSKTTRSGSMVALVMPEEVKKAALLPWRCWPMEVYPPCRGPGFGASAACKEAPEAGIVSV